MPTYAITAPNGKSLDVTGDHVPTEAELQQIFKAAGVETAASPAAAQPAAHMSAALPGKAIASDDPNIIRGAIGPKSRQFLDTPLAHTGIGAVDRQTSPANLAITAGTLALAVERAAAVPAQNILMKAKAAMTAVAETAAPAIKYEVSKAALEAMHVPPSLAAVIAMGVSGYKSKGKTTAPATEPVAETPKAAGYDRYMSNVSAAPAAAASPAAASGPPLAPYEQAIAASKAAHPPQPMPEPVETSAAPPPRSTPSTSDSAPSPTLKSLMAAGMKPTEAARALKLLQQGATPAEAEARILSARPSAASVAPETAAPPAPSPVQLATNIRPGVPPSPTQIESALGIAARRAKVTLTAEDVTALKPLIQQGVTPEAAIQQLPALKLQQMPGVMTPEQVAAEIAARGPGNRSPKR